MEPHDDTHEDKHQDTSRYSLDVDAIAGRFQAAGFSFSPRSASRWCAKAHLDCILLPIESGRIEKYFATPDSVDTEIEKMRRFHNVAMTRHDATEQDTSSHGEPESAPLQDLTDKLAQTEDALQKALTRATGNEAVAVQLRKDRAEILEQLRRTERGVGVLQDRLLRLGGDAEFPSLPSPGQNTKMEFSEPAEEAPGTNQGENHSRLRNDESETSPEGE